MSSGHGIRRTKLGHMPAVYRLDRPSYSWTMCSTRTATRHSAAGFPGAYSRSPKGMSDSIAATVRAPSTHKLASLEARRPDWGDLLGGMDANADGGSGVDLSARLPRSRPQGGMGIRGASGSRAVRLFRSAMPRSLAPHAYDWVDPSPRADECR